MPSIRARLVAGRVLGLLGQGIPAADDPGGIVQREIAVGGEGALKGAAHLGLGDREHQDLVVGEQPVLHGPPEPEPVKLGPWMDSSSMEARTRSLRWALSLTSGAWTRGVAVM